MARLPRRALRIWDSLRAERRTVRQGLVALTLSTAAGFLAGLTLAHLTDRLASLPGLLVLIPAAVGMKGTIFGAIGARLGTANAAGVLRPTLERSGVLRRNVEIGMLTTFSSALWLAVLARVASAAFGQPSLEIWRLALVAVVGGAIGSILVMAITIGLSIVSYRRGWDLDSVSTPLVTALGDMTTLPSLFAASILLGNDRIAGAVAAIAIVIAIAATARSYLVGDRAIRRVVLEMTPTMLLTPILDVIAGAILATREPQLVAVPVVLALLPPFVSQAGALGGIFASRTTSKLQIGVITPRGLPEGPAIVDALVTAVQAFVTYALIGLVAFAVGDLTGLAAMPDLGTLLRGTLLAGAIVVPLKLLVGYELAVLTYRFGLDPDNQAVPVITSVMDLVGVAVVLSVMTSSGVLPHG